MPWFVKIETGIVNKATFDQYVPAHKTYVQNLVVQGHRAKSGYWAELGGGMLLFHATDLDVAKKIVAADPLIMNDCVEYELHEWCIVVE